MFSLHTLRTGRRLRGQPGVRRAHDPAEFVREPARVRLCHAGVTRRRCRPPRVGQRGEQRLEPPGSRLDVVVEEHQHRRAAEFRPGIAGPRRAGLASVIDDLDTLATSARSRSHEGIVVVDGDDHLGGRRRLRLRRGDRAPQHPEALLGVARDHDAGRSPLWSTFRVRGLKAGERVRLPMFA